MKLIDGNEVVWQNQLILSEDQLIYGFRLSWIQSNLQRIVRKHSIR